MNYDLRDKDERRRFISYANQLLRLQRTNVCLKDESNRTLNQNAYIHVLCRILAADIGVTERYAKDVYFKDCANKDIFDTTMKDPLTNQIIVVRRSTCDLTITEMRRAISNFRNWAADQGYYLPEAVLHDDGSMVFASDKDKEAYDQAIIKTSKLDGLI